MRRSENQEQEQYLGSFHAIPGVPLYTGWAEHLRTGIESGIFAPGEPLPALRRMSKVSGVNYFSVQLATEQLLKENLVCKVRGKGMFVRGQVPNNGVIGILIMGRNPTMFQNTVGFLCSAQLADMGYETITIHDARPDAELETPAELLARLVAGKRLQAVIGISVPFEARIWYDRLPLPLSGPGVDGLRRMSGWGKLKAALESGAYSRPFLVLPHSRGISLGAGSIETIDDLKAQKIDPEQYRWAGISYDFVQKNHCYARQTLEILRKEFAAPEKPDLLFVFPDEALPGAVAAIYEAGLRVPEDLTLFAHRNVEFPVFSPFPTEFIEASCADFAHSLIQKLNLPINYLKKGDKK